MRTCAYASYVIPKSRAFFFYRSECEYFKDENVFFKCRIFLYISNQMNYHKIRWTILGWLHSFEFWDIFIRNYGFRLNYRLYKLMHRMMLFLVEGKQSNEHFHMDLFEESAFYWRVKFVRHPYKRVAVALHEVLSAHWYHWFG